MWEIEKIVSKGDYNYAVVRNHPRATRHGYVLEHRVVVENHLGRLLTEDEVVHHKNEITKDNRLENLEALTKAEHNRHHHYKGNTVALICNWCGDIVIKKFNQRPEAKGQRYAYCNRSCSGSASRQQQLAPIA